MRIPFNESDKIEVKSCRQEQKQCNELNEA